MKLEEFRERFRKRVETKHVELDPEDQRRIDDAIEDMKKFSERAMESMRLPNEMFEGLPSSENAWDRARLLAQTLAFTIQEMGIIVGDVTCTRSSTMMSSVVRVGFVIPDRDPLRLTAHFIDALKTLTYPGRGNS